MIKSLLDSLQRKYYLVPLGLFILATSVLLLQTDLDRRADLANIFLPVYNLLATLCFFWAAKRVYSQSPRLSSGWLILGLAQASALLGDLTYSIRESVLGEQAYLPSITDIFFLLTYPLFLTGILHFPARFRSRLDATKGIIQIAIIMIAAFLIFWNFLIGPLIEQTGLDDPLYLAITIAYPLGDLLTLLAVLVLIFRRHEDAWLKPVYLIATGITALIIGDTYYSFEALQGTYLSGSLADLAYLASYMLFGSAGVLQALQSPGNILEANGGRRPGIKIDITGFLPFGWVAIAFVFMIFSADGHFPMSFPVVAIFVGLLIALVIILQYLTLAENTWLTKRLGQANEALETRVLERTSQLNKTVKDLEMVARAREQVTEDLQASRELYRAVVEDLPVLICRYHKDGRLTFVNDAYCRYFDRSSRMVLGSSFHDHIPEADRRYVEEIIHGLTPDQPNATMDYRVYAPKGEIRWQRWTNHAMFRDGQLLEYQSIGEDITEHKLAEEALRASEEKLRDLFENSSELIQLVAPDGHFLFTNPAWRAALGYTEEDIPRLSMWDVLTPECQVACRTHLQEALKGKTLVNLPVRFRAANGNILYVEGNINCSFEDGKPVYIRGIFRDMSERIRAEELLRRQAYTDPLTGLPNRVHFMERLRRGIEIQRQDPSFQFTLFFMDIDNFKLVNDSLGHPIGDQLLIAISERLREWMREEDLVCRLGGDEFVILCNHMSDRGRAVQLAERLLQDLRQPVLIQSHVIVITASIGIVLGDAREDADSMLQDADIALYKAKSLGKDQVTVFESSLRENSRERMQLEHDLRQALERQEFRIRYQPIYNLPERQIVGFEALLRWQHPERGLLLPKEFLTVSEETGLIVPIGEWVLQQACHQLSQWQETIPDASRLVMSINLSAYQLTHADLESQIETALVENGLHPWNLAVELTETALMEDNEKTNFVLTSLDQKGVRIYIDDFGTGYSSLERLQHLPIRTIKINQVFIQQFDQDPNSQGILRAVGVLGQELGLEAIAEGVETPEQLQCVEELGYRYAQGYLFSYPVPSEDAYNLLLHPQGEHG